MGCKQTDNVGAYVGRRLSDEQREKYEIHLQNCVRCRSEVKIFSKIKEVLKTRPLYSIPKDAPKIDVVDRTLATIHAIEQDPKYLKLVAKHGSEEKVPEADYMKIAKKYFNKK